MTHGRGACTREVDLSGIERHGVGWMAYFVKAFAQGLESDRIGVAFELPTRRAVAVVPDARDASLHDLAVRVAELAARAAAGTLGGLDVGGPAATVTEPGAGSAALERLAPFVAGEPILAPSAVSDERCRLTLSYDRAQDDQAGATRLLERVVERLASFTRDP